VRDLEHALKHGACPILNGLLYPDGSVLLVDSLPSGPGAPTFGPRTSLDALDATEPLEWTTVGTLAEAVSPDGSYSAVGGEGGMGGDGFVAVTAAADKRLLWVAFFEDSNSFEEIRFDGGDVVARSNLGREYRFPVTAPERLVVT
jgi:hypothetical protein